MPGARKDIESEYQAAQLFALASRWEGFPNAVAEAMAHGLPAIGFAGCAGIADLIEHRGNGLLAPGNGDAEALGAVLKIAMDDAGLRSRFGSAGLGVSKRYRPKEVWGVWENALDEIAPPAS
jgi:glycosyltransferase involved in cell wall biosynthesis